MIARTSAIPAPACGAIEPRGQDPCPLQSIRSLRRESKNNEYARVTTSGSCGGRAVQNGGSASVLPDFHLSLRVMLSVDVARGPSSEGPL